MTTTILALVGLWVGVLLVLAAVKRRPAPSPERAPNALGLVRVRLHYSRAHVASVLGVSVADVETLETTPLRLLEIGEVEHYVKALDCRLDVVAQHIDGAAVWLSDDRAGDDP